MKGMRKTKTGRRFAMEVISRAIADNRLVTTLRTKVKERLAGIDATRVRQWCFILLAAMLVGDIVLLFRAGERSRAAPVYSVIRPVATGGEQPHRPAIKEFGVVWDSLMADSGSKAKWDSLLLVRPGLRDTVRQLQKMDSAVLGR
jgi:hypothetical protein